MVKFPFKYLMMLEENPKEPFYLYNSLTRQKEIFRSIEPGWVKIYSCGPTVYDFPHIGNFRSFLFADLLHRVFKLLGYRVTLVMNLTDIDDKTIQNSIKYDQTLEEFTEPYIEAFFEDLKSLSILPAQHYPRATEHIPEMETMIQKLIDKGHAYFSDDSVYFKLSSFPDYGKLSNIKLDQQKAGAGQRVMSDEYEREDISDFVLWKKHQKEDGEVYFQSSLGRGRPGWHIECSAMSEKYLGENFDLHTGGIDNRFPHHENEIAQSVCATGGQFVNYWLHVSHLLVDQKKMSKSENNFYQLRDLLEKGVSPKMVRYMLLSTHYRNHYNFSLSNVEAALKAINRMEWFAANLADLEHKIIVKQIPDRETLSTVSDKIRKKHGEFIRALKDDLNVSLALASVFELMTYLNKSLEQISWNQIKRVIDFLNQVNQVFAVFDFPFEVNGKATKEELSQKNEFPQEVIQLMKERIQARKDKNFERSDQLRDKIYSFGYQVLDHVSESKLRKIDR